MRKETKVKETKTIVTYYCDKCGKDLGNSSGHDCYGCNNTYCDKCRSKQLTYISPGLLLCLKCIKHRQFIDDAKKLQDQINKLYKKFWKECKRKF